MLPQETILVSVNWFVVFGAHPYIEAAWPNAYVTKNLPKNPKAESLDHML
jgi:hypothetical protein